MTRLLLLGPPVLALTVALVRRFVVRVEVSGESMRPTFEHGERVLAMRVAPAKIRTGHIIVMASPPGGGAQAQALVDSWNPRYEVVDRDPVASNRAARHPWAIKRVAAVAGDRVPFPVPDHPDDAIVPSGSVVVLGDNRDSSVDSRHHGYVSLDQVLGKVLWAPHPSPDGS
jgi:signal peptidase I